MRILHCSDIHECRPLNWRDLRGKRIFGCLNWLLRRRWSHLGARWLRFLESLRDNPPEVLAITGDLAQLGTAVELSLAAQPLYDLEQLGVRILYVPGNHDRYIARDQEAEACLEKITADFSGRKIMDSGLSVMANGKAEFILLSQARPRGLISWTGFMAETQWQALAALAGKHPEDRARIVLGHYPVCDARGRELSGSRRLEEAPRLKNLLAKLDARLYLSGHIHQPYEISLSRNCEQLVAGSITAAGSYYEINLEGNEVSWERKLIR